MKVGVTNKITITDFTLLEDRIRDDLDPKVERRMVGSLVPVEGDHRRLPLGQGGGGRGPEPPRQVRHGHSEAQVLVRGVDREGGLLRGSACLLASA